MSEPDAVGPSAGSPQEEKVASPSPLPQFKSRKSVVFVDTGEHSEGSAQTGSEMSGLRHSMAISAYGKHRRSTANLSRVASVHIAPPSKTTIIGTGEVEEEDEEFKDGDVITAAELRNMQEAFNMFDADHSGSIDYEELQELLAAIGIQLGEDATKALIAEVTEESAEVLHFPDFVRLVLFWKTAARFRLLELVGTLHETHIKTALEVPASLSDTTWRWFWDVLMFVVICYLVGSVGYLYAVFVGSRSLLGENDSAKSFLLSVEVIVAALMLADGAIWSITAKRSGRSTITDRKVLLSEYIRSGIFFDLIPTIPLWLMVPDEAVPYVLPLRFLKLPRFWMMWKESGRVPMSRLYVTLNFQLLPIITGAGAFFTMIHLAAVVAMYQDETMRYSTAIYTAMYIVSGVGYGDGTSMIDTNGKRWYSMFLMVISMGINGYVVGGIVSYSSVTDVEQERKMKLRETAAICEYFEVPEALEDEILMFQDHVLRHHLSTVYFDLVSGLPDEMKLHIAIVTRIAHIDRHPFFGSAHRGVRLALAQLLESLIYVPEEYIVLADDEASEMFFVTHGFIDVQSRRGLYIQTLKAGDHFGEAALFHQKVHIISVKALTYCDLYILSKERFDSVTRRFHHFRDTVLQLTQDFLRKRTDMLVVSEFGNPESERPANPEVKMQRTESWLRSSQRTQSSPMHEPSVNQPESLGGLNNSTSTVNLQAGLPNQSRRVSLTAAVDSYVEEFDSVRPEVKRPAEELLLYGEDVEIKGSMSTMDTSVASSSNRNSQSREHSMTSERDNSDTAVPRIETTAVDDFTPANDSFPGVPGIVTSGSFTPQRLGTNSLAGRSVLAPFNPDDVPLVTASSGSATTFSTESPSGLRRIDSTRTRLTRKLKARRESAVDDLLGAGLNGLLGSSTNTNSRSRDRSSFLSGHSGASLFDTAPPSTTARSPLPAGLPPGATLSHNGEDMLNASFGLHQSISFRVSTIPRSVSNQNINKSFVSEAPPSHHPSIVEGSIAGKAEASTTGTTMEEVMGIVQAIESEMAIIDQMLQGRHFSIASNDSSPDGSKSASPVHSPRGSSKRSKSKASVSDGFDITSVTGSLTDE